MRPPLIYEPANNTKKRKGQVNPRLLLSIFALSCSPVPSAAQRLKRNLLGSLQFQNSSFRNCGIPLRLYFAEHPVVAAEHPPEHPVVAAEHPPEHPVVAAEHPVVELGDVCATAPATPKIENATANTTKTAAIFLAPVLRFFLGGVSISGETSITKGIFSIAAPSCFLTRFIPALYTTP